MKVLSFGEISLRLLASGCTKLFQKDNPKADNDKNDVLC